MLKDLSDHASSICCCHFAFAAPTNIPLTSEAIYKRIVFHVGGQYVKSPEANGTIATDQMYVEQLTSTDGVTKPHPLVFLHGGGPTGTLWLNTPDYRTGWASYFVQKGYAVHVADIPGVGRSALTLGAKPPSPSPPRRPSRPLPDPSYSPISILKHASTINGPARESAVTLPSIPADNEKVETATANAVCELLKQVGPSYIIAHSYTGMMSYVITDQCPDSVQDLFSVEPNSTPFQSKYGLTDVPLTYDPPVTIPDTDIEKVEVGEKTTANVSCLLQAAPAKKLVNVAKVPVAFYTTEASIHVVVDHCEAAYLWQSGVSLDWILLADRGIKGNGQFSFLEKNNIEIAEKIVEPWLELQSGPDGFKQKGGNTAQS
ncbi:MAG: hypothetical protein Q9219_005950 [cf. Caloplaca sp. 3 TL-2023]